MIKICTFGHRIIANPENIKQKLYDVLTKYLTKDFVNFFVGIHGNFDKISISCARNLKREYSNLQINVMFTNMSFLKKNKNGISKIDDYKDCLTFMYPIENIYFKRQIVIANQMMIDECDIVICYINPNIANSGAARAVNYAIKQNKTIINLYDL